MRSLYLKTVLDPMASTQIHELGVTVEETRSAFGARMHLALRAPEEGR